MINFPKTKVTLAMPENTLSFDELRRANIERLPHFATKTDVPEWSTAQWTNALLGELGEFANIIKKIDRGDFTLQDARAELADELADIQTYLDLLALHIDVDLGKATIKKWNEVSRRIDYPGRL